MAESDEESGGGGNSRSKGGGVGGGGVGGVGGELWTGREQDRFLPIANVSRIMKKALPANAKISKEAKETVQECVSEFISFITGEASDKCQREKRKTVNGDDLLWAMTTLGFEDYVDPLKIYLQKFREIEGEKAGLGPSPNNSQTPQKDSAGGGPGMMMMMMGQQIYGNHTLLYQNQNQHQHQHQHQMGMGMGMGDGSSSASSSARGDRIL